MKAANLYSDNKNSKESIEDSYQSMQVEYRLKYQVKQDIYGESELIIQLVTFNKRNVNLRSLCIRCYHFCIPLE